MTDARAGERAFAFVDLSNIYYGRMAAAERNGENPPQVRLSAEQLARLLRAGRSEYQQVTVANADVPTAVTDYFRQVGDVMNRESGRLTGTEQANDETIQVRMYEAMHQHPPSVMVLATGDGAGWRKGRGFVPALEAARQHKWGIEVVAWADSTNPQLREWVTKVGGAFINLDDHYYSITFEERGRRVQPINLRSRAMGVPLAAKPSGR